MPRDLDNSDSIAEAVRTAAETASPLRIVGGGSKPFYGRPVSGSPLETTNHRGIVSYEPTELVLTARAGTPLAEIEHTLAEKNQMLAFEPPHFGGDATLGGALASGLSGPRRPFTGSARDMILGTRVINGRGEVMRFGGEVMKNVAGYDVSRLMVGALGTLGVLLEASLKVLPRPRSELTVILEEPASAVFTHAEAWRRAGLPLSALAHDGERLYVRLSGSESGVRAGGRQLGGERLDDAAAFWRALRDHDLPFFQGDDPPLWRLSLPPGSGPARLDGLAFIDWAGQQAWWRSHDSAAHIRAEAQRLGGHATCFRGGEADDGPFHPLPPGLAAIHRHLRKAFDPGRLLNRDAMYEGL